MTQYQPIKRPLVANRGEDNRGADQRLASLNVLMNECDFIHQEQT
ncbi:hypothetical protein [Aeromonas rivipollensis]|nr:hypothetical protein [Aeromonas rivipollensis]